MVSKKSTKKSTKKAKSHAKAKSHTKHKSHKKFLHTKHIPPIAKKQTQNSSSNSSSKKTLGIVLDRDIATDFAGKIYQEFDTLVKSVILFGSAAKQESTTESDIDIIIIIDDVSIRFDDELIAWYRKNLGRIVSKNKYIKPLHINTVKLSTWWQDLMRGDPIVVNVLRYGDAIIDFGGFFNPLKILLKEGKIKSTPEAIYTLLERAPTHLARARNATLATIDGMFWCMVDASHAALISADIMPPSPEKIPEFLNEYFVKNKLLNKKYIGYYEEIRTIAKEIVHGKRSEVSGKYIDDWLIKTDEFLKQMAKLVEDIIRNKK
jgi:uncharacterized protein (UPF0332 family)